MAWDRPNQFSVWVGYKFGMHWFATTGEHRVAVISAIAVARAAKGPHAAFDFLEQHIEDRR